jgi:hypothetical protein
MRNTPTEWRGLDREHGSDTALEMRKWYLEATVSRSGTRAHSGAANGLPALEGSLE